MKITQDVRDYAAQIEVSETEALERGMQEKAEEFRQAVLRCIESSDHCGINLLRLHPTALSTHQTL